jgi:hypothetical protein
MLLWRIYLTSKIIWRGNCAAATGDIFVDEDNDRYTTQNREVGRFGHVTSERPKELKPRIVTDDVQQDRRLEPILISWKTVKPLPSRTLFSTVVSTSNEVSQERM